MSGDLIGWQRIIQTPTWDGMTAAQRAYASAPPNAVVPLPPSASARLTTANGIPTTVVASGGTAHSSANATFFSPVKFDAPDLRPVAWLVLGLLLRGEVAILAGMGGSAKTALAVLIAVTLAAGRTTVGPFAVNNQSNGLRVAFISGEEDEGSLGLLVAAACNILALDATERARVRRNLFVHDATKTGLQFGLARAGHRENICPPDQDAALSELKAVLIGVDVLIMDTLSALFALQNENDNNQITSLMRRVTAAAREANCAVLILHHTPKMTREAAAGLRGEASLVRGGSAIVNSARVVLTITSPPDAEGAAFVMANMRPDSVRRLEHAKLNNMPPMAPSCPTSAPMRQIWRVEEERISGPS